MNPEDVKNLIDAAVTHAVDQGVALGARTLLNFAKQLVDANTKLPARRLVEQMEEFYNGSRVLNPRSKRQGSP